MKHIFIFFSLLLACKYNVSAQFVSNKKPQSKNEFRLCYNPRLYFNNVNIDNDDIASASLSTGSTNFNTNVSLEYQRNTKYGLIYGLRFEFGTRSFDVNVTSSFKNFDTVASLKPLPDSVNNFQSKNKYIGLNVFVGYRQNLGFMGLKNVDVEGKIGIGKIGFIDGHLFQKAYSLAYWVNDSFLVYGTPVTNIGGQFGNGGRSMAGPLVGNAYLGFITKCNYGVIRNVNLGFTFTHRVILPFKPQDEFSRKHAQKSGEIRVVNYNRLNGIAQPTGRDVFNNKEMSFGIKLGIGFSFF